MAQYFHNATALDTVCQARRSDWTAAMKPVASTKRRRGVAAVEFAILLPLLVILLAAPLYLGRVMWHYTVIQKAAHDAALYMSTVSEAEMRTPALMTAARTLATDLVGAELSDLPSGDYPPTVTVECDGWPCDGYMTPAKVGIKIHMRVQDPFFDTGYSGYDGILISANVQMAYIGTQ